MPHTTTSAIASVPEIVAELRAERGIAVFLDWLLVHMFARLAEFTRNEEDEFDRRDDPRGSAGGFSGGFGR